MYERSVPKRLHYVSKLQGDNSYLAMLVSTECYVTWGRTTRASSKQILCVLRQPLQCIRVFSIISHLKASRKSTARVCSPFSATLAIITSPPLSIPKSTVSPLKLPSPENLEKQYHCDGMSEFVGFNSFGYTTTCNVRW